MLYSLTLRNKQSAVRNGQSRDTGNIGYTRHRTKTNKTRNITQKTERAIKNGQSRDTATLGTQDTGQRQTKQQTQHRKLKGQSRMDNPEIQQHWAHKTQDKDKQNKKHNTEN